MSTHFPSKPQVHTAESFRSDLNTNFNINMAGEQQLVTRPVLQNFAKRTLYIPDPRADGAKGRDVYFSPLSTGRSQPKPIWDFSKTANGINYSYVFARILRNRMDRVLTVKEKICLLFFRFHMNFYFWCQPIQNACKDRYANIVANAVKQAIKENEQVQEKEEIAEARHESVSERTDRKRKKLARLRIRNS